MPPVSAAAGLATPEFRSSALFALGLSLSAYLGAAWLAYALVRRLGPAALRPAWLVDAGRFVYYVLFPYLLLLKGMGLLSAALGLLGPEPLARSVLGWSTAWLEGVLWAAGAAACTWAALAWSLHLSRRGGAPGGPQTTLPRGWALLREAVFMQAHWAFYRALLSVWFDPYAAAFAGLALILAEAALAPPTWWALRRPAPATALVVNAALAWMSAAIFIFTGNLWLSLAAHIAVLGLLPQLPVREPALA